MTFRMYAASLAPRLARTSSRIASRWVPCSAVCWGLRCAVASGLPDPTAHLSPQQIEELGTQLDAIREEVLASRGASDAAYIRKVIKAQRICLLYTSDA